MAKPKAASDVGGDVMRLKAIVLHPRTLHYVRRQGGEEIEVSADEVCRLGEDAADSCRSIVTSAETLNLIVSTSIRQLDALREATGTNRLKIIASALNSEHGRQIVEAYRVRGRRADAVPARDDCRETARVMQELNRDDLDVIVQVRTLSQDFEHRFFAVAAVFGIFTHLSSFVQFVTRMVGTPHGLPGGSIRVVVFHAPAGVAARWEDLQHYCEADQELFDQLLPIEDVDRGV